jgi:hypothetical protein
VSSHATEALPGWKLCCHCGERREREKGLERGSSRKKDDTRRSAAKELFPQPGVVGNTFPPLGGEDTQRVISFSLSLSVSLLFLSLSLSLTLSFSLL